MPLAPRSKQRSADAGVTLVGGLDSVTPASVDGAGLVSLDGLAWSVDWWIGAGDRWYFPSVEASVRQRRRGFGPVIETSLRVPGGDVVHSVHAVVLDEGEAVVVEVANTTSTPVSLALAVRPYRADGMTTSIAVDVGDDEAIRIDGRPAVVLPRPPSDRLAAADEDLADRLPELLVEGFAQRSNRRQPHDDCAAQGQGANAVVVFPLPHGVTIRFVLPGPSLGPVDAADRLPDAGSAARGWDAVVNAGARFTFPDPAVTNLAGAARARQLLGDTLPSEPLRPSQFTPTLAALAAGGHDLEARRWLVAFARSFPTSAPDPAAAAEFLSGVGLAAATANADELTEALLEPATQLCYLVERAEPEPEVVARAIDGLARLSAVAGQSDAARELALRVAELGGLAAPALDTVTILAEQSRDSGRFGLDDDADLAARYWLAAHAMMTRDRIDSPTIDLLPSFPTAWRGGPVEVHNAPGIYGLVSFAIRWHGARPALLWEFNPYRTPRSPTVGAVRLRCPGLDPDWSSTEVRGEALLAGSADELPEAPAPGQSFQ